MEGFEIDYSTIQKELKIFQAHIKGIEYIKELSITLMQLCDEVTSKKLPDNFEEKDKNLVKFVCIKYNIEYIELNDFYIETGLNKPLMKLLNENFYIPFSDIGKHKKGEKLFYSFEHNKIISTKQTPKNSLPETAFIELFKGEYNREHLTDVAKSIKFLYQSAIPYKYIGESW